MEKTFIAAGVLIGLAIAQFVVVGTDRFVIVLALWVVAFIVWAGLFLCESSH